MKHKPMLVTSGPLRPDSNRYAFIRRSVGPRSSAATSVGKERRWRLTILSLVLLTGVACDSFPAADSVGAVFNEAGQPVLLFEPCDRDTAERVSLIKRKGDDPYDGDDSLLWAITSSTSRTQLSYEFVVGEVPAGYEEEQPLRDMPELTDLIALIETEKGFSLSVLLDDLQDVEPGQVVDGHGDILSEEDFRTQNEERC